MTASEAEQRAVKPVYLSGVLTVEAELSAGRLYDGSAHAENASCVAVALVFIGGQRCCSPRTRAASSPGSASRDPGSSALPMTLRASSPGRGSSLTAGPATGAGTSEAGSPACPAGRDRHRGNQPRQHR